jgi:hypothetical protein
MLSVLNMSFKIFVVIQNDAMLSDVALENKRDY